MQEESTSSHSLLPLHRHWSTYQITIVLGPPSPRHRIYSLFCLWKFDLSLIDGTSLSASGTSAVTERPHSCQRVRTSLVAQIYLSSPSCSVASVHLHLTGLLVLTNIPLVPKLATISPRSSPAQLYDCINLDLCPIPLELFCIICIKVTLPSHCAQSMIQ